MNFWENTDLYLRIQKLKKSKIQNIKNNNKNKLNLNDSES